MNASKRGTPTAWTDPDDAPELTDEFFEQADEYVGEKLIRRGRPAGSHKTATTIRFDDEVIEAFKSTGKGWQTRMNAALKDWLKSHPPA
ncbi:BrnA antitoxin family protein [Castellaniella hirudinis]|uniref:BrnA antitoxin family protein n=1 Tax=Castellaniella hirudinis TaxID=1144617 RepID=UPI0039C253DE